MPEISDTDGDDIYALDKWLRRLGLWRGSSLRKQSEEERRATLDEMDFSRPLAWSRGAFDPDGYQLVSLVSHTSYDPKTREFNDKIVYWRYTPWEEGETAPRSQDQYVLQIRGIRDPNQPKGEIPRILPEQIWWNGSPLFDGQVYGGPHSAYRPEYNTLFNRIAELSKRVKERLNDPSTPLHEIGKDFDSAAQSLSLAKALTGSAPSLRGFGSKGWDAIEGLVHSFMTSATLRPGQKISFPLPTIRARGDDLTPGAKAGKGQGDITTAQRLQVLHGFYLNTLEPVRSMMEDRDEVTSSLHSGVSYVAGADYFYDKNTNRHVFRHMIAPEAPMDGSHVPDPFDVVRLEYSQSGDICTLEEASFMGVTFTPKNPREQLALVGLAQACNADLARRRFPDFKNHVYRHRLQDHIQEMRIPPLLEETGGEFGWIPFVGHSLEKQAEKYGNDLGGGNGYMSRGLRKDGSLSEVMTLQDIAWMIGGADSNYAGAQANFMKHIAAIRKGVITITHDHFDHATLEFLAKQTDEKGNGLLKGVRVMCREDVAYMIKKRLTKQGVRKENFPDFMTYERVDGTYDPRLVKLKGDRLYAYPSKDEDGMVRMWTVACANGSLHTAETDMFGVIGCYGDNHYTPMFINPADCLKIRPHGWDFIEKGPMVLAGAPGVSEEKLRASIKDPNRHSVILDDPTNATSDGYAPTIEQFKDTIRKVLQALPPGHAISHHTFSTSHLEIKATREVCNEPGTLRNMTSLGANAELRDTCMNIHGVDPFTDLRTIEIPYNLLPVEAYHAVMHGLEDFLHEKQKQKAPDKLQKDALYQAMKSIHDLALREQEGGGHVKTKMLYDAFFGGNPHAIEDIIVSLGFPRAEKPRSTPGIISKALDNMAQTARAVLVEEGQNPDADTAYFMLTRLAADGVVSFKTKGSWDDTNMAAGILRGQETVALHAGRDSQEGKAFANDPGTLFALSTGAIGSADEDEASLSKYAKGRSLYDTSYPIDTDKLIFLITQTASMGEDAENSQSALVRDIVNNRGNTVFQAFKGGFYIHNPKEYKDHYLKAFGEEGWKPKWDGANNRIRVNQPIHVHGHAFYADIQDRMADPRYKALLVEAAHLPSVNAFKRWQEIPARTGRRTSIQNPKNFVFHKLRENEKGEPYLEEADILTPSYWLVQVGRKFGLQFGAIPRMVLAVLNRRTGGRTMDALEARSGVDGFVAEESALQRENDWLKPNNAQASARAAGLGPSLADMQKAGGKPTGRTPSSILHQSRWAGGTYSAPGKDLE